MWLLVEERKQTRNQLKWRKVEDHLKREANVLELNLLYLRRAEVVLKATV